MEPFRGALAQIKVGKAVNVPKLVEIVSFQR